MALVSDPLKSSVHENFCIVRLDDYRFNFNEWL